MYLVRRLALALAVLAFAAGAAASQDPPRIGVMRFEAGEGVEASVADFSTEALAQNLALSGRFRVVDWVRLERAIAAVLERNPNFSQEDAAEQAVDELGLDGLCRGSIRVMGDTSYVRVWKTDKHGDIVKAAQGTFQEKGEVEAAVRQVAQSIAGVSEEPGQDAPGAGTAQTTRTGVRRLTLRPTDDSTDHMRFVNNRLASEIVNSERFGVISWSEVERAITRKAQSEPGLSHGEARSQALRELGVDRVIETSLARIGNHFHITAKILDRGLAVSRIAEETADKEGELADAVKELALKIVLTPEEYAELLEERKRKEREEAQKQRDRQRQQAERQRQQQEQRKQFKNSIGMEFRLIEPGRFIMGSNDGEPDERPIRVVDINRAFYMGVHPVTQEQYEKVMRSNPSYFDGPNRPVERVSWLDVQEFLTRLSVMDRQANYRLPTEAEWEYACRAGTQTHYFWGDEFDGDYAWFRGNSGNTTQDVGTREPNPWGMHDMSGNVWEWVQDYYRENYHGAQTRNPTGPRTGRHVVLRGGSWVNAPEMLRSAKRRSSHPSYRHAVIGFRVVADR